MDKRFGRTQSVWDKAAARLLLAYRLLANHTWLIQCTNQKSDVIIGAVIHYKMVGSTEYKPHITNRGPGFLYIVYHSYGGYKWNYVNILRPEQNGGHFADNIFLNEKLLYIEISQSLFRKSNRQLVDIGSGHLAWDFSNHQAMTCTNDDSVHWCVRSMPNHCQFQGVCLLKRHKE